MKEFQLTLQEKYDFCVCSALQAILRKYDINLSQEDISKNLTPSKNGGYMVDDARISDFLLSKGFEYKHYFWNTTPLNERDSLLEEMNQNEGILGINKHFYILKYFKDPDLEIIDPDNGNVIKKDIFTLLREMKEKEGSFGLIKKL